MSPTVSIMQSSFYGMSMLGREEDERFKNVETELSKDIDPTSF